MQILYFVTMAAAFTLCVALLLIARRILRKPPLHSGELLSSHLKGGAVPSIEATECMENAGPLDGFAADSERRGSETSPTPAEADRYDYGRHTQQEQTLDNHDRAEPESASPVIQQISKVENSTLPASPANAGGPKSMHIVPAGAQSGKARRRKSSTPAYAYFLEVLFIGVTAVVLVRTQRSTLRYRALLSTRSRVA